MGIEHGQREKAATMFHFQRATPMKKNEIFLRQRFRDCILGGHKPSSKTWTLLSCKLGVLSTKDKKTTLCITCFLMSRLGYEHTIYLASLRYVFDTLRLISRIGFWTL